MDTTKKERALVTNPEGIYKVTGEESTVHFQLIRIRTSLFELWLSLDNQKTWEHHSTHVQIRYAKQTYKWLCKQDPLIRTILNGSPPNLCKILSAPPRRPTGQTWENYDKWTDSKMTRKEKNS